jgi:hypothetical protein
METDQFEEITAAFLSWLSEVGVSISPKMQLVDLRSEGRGRGVSKSIFIAVVLPIQNLVNTSKFENLFSWPSTCADNFYQSQPPILQKTRSYLAFPEQQYSTNIMYSGTWTPLYLSLLSKCHLGL